MPVVTPSMIAHRASLVGRAPDKPLGVAMLSFAHVHAGGYADAVTEDPRTQIRVVWDEVPERGRDRADHYGVPYEPSLEVAVGRDDVDAVVVNSMTNNHHEVYFAAVNAGKHIFTEKPVAVDAVGIRRFIEAARKAEANKLSVVAGTQRRHQTPYVETVKRIHGGEIGEILSGRAYWIGTLPFSHERKPEWSDLEYRLRNWYNQIWTCGDNILEQHVHNLDVINWALNAHPERVVASGGRAWKPFEERYGDIWDNFTCDYEYPGGVHILSMSRHWENSKNAVFEEVTGTKGKSSCCNLGKETSDPYVQEHIDLYASIRGTGPYLNEGVQVAESCLTAIMGRMAAYTGAEVSWDDALKSDLSLVPEELDFAKAYPLGPIPVPGQA